MRFVVFVRNQKAVGASLYDILDNPLIISEMMKRMLLLGESIRLAW